MKLAALFAVVTLLPAGALAQPSPPLSKEPIAQIGLYGYRADGTVAGSAYDTAPELSSIVYINGARCIFGAGDRPAPADATDAWQFSGKVLSSTPEQAVVQIEWRRLIAAGQPVSGNESSLQVTVRRDEPVQLDHAAFRPNCQTVSVGFEARYEARFASLMTGMGGGAGGSGASAGGQASAGGGGVRIGTGAGSGGGTGSGGGAGSGGVSVRSASAAGAGGGAGSGTGLFDVNLWLVRSVPGQPDEVTHTLLRMNQDGASFAFAPVALTTSRGDAIAQVTGTLAVVRGSDGEGQLVFTTARRVVHTAPGQTPRDGNDVQGTSRIVNRMPGPQEVLSFEMPPITVNGQQAAPDQFSVRLKIAPRR